LSDKVGSDFFPPSYYTLSVSNNGVLVFDPSLKQRQLHLYSWVDRHGHKIKSLEVPAGTFYHSLSPNEKRFIADRSDPQIGSYDLWLYDVSGGNPQLFTFDPATDIDPIWAPNGNSIVWASTRDGIANLYQKAASLAGEESRLLKSDHPKVPTDWSRDGAFIIYSQVDSETKLDVWALPMTGSDKDKPLSVVRTKDNETAGTLSPDGRWLAYSSDKSGHYEIYVQSFPDRGGKRKVSNGGGLGPRWRGDGQELFYYTGDGKLMATPAPPGESFETGPAVPL